MNFRQMPFNSLSTYTSMLLIQLFTLIPTYICINPFQNHRYKIANKKQRTLRSHIFAYYTVQSRNRVTVVCDMLPKQMLEEQYYESIFFFNSL